MALTPLKQQVLDVVAEHAATIVEVSRSIHSRPEVMFEEQHAHALLTDVLAAAGWPVQRQAKGIGTAFVAERGEGSGPLVAICCEYDALPDIGHACGHNVIAAAGLGAALAAGAVATAAGGRVRLLGTPAEEGGNGKGLLAEFGAFDDVDAVLMVHPGDRDLRYMTTLAASSVMVTYHGKAAHAAASPWHGRNALDAAVLGYSAIAAMRQQLAPDQRVHGTFLEVPEKSNIIPERVVARWVGRGRTTSSAREVRDKVLACLRGGAAAANCEIELDVSPVGSQVLDCGPLVDAYVANSAAIDRVVLDPADAGHIYGSTDLGRISRRWPSIHPVIKVAPEGIGIHERAFTDAAGSASGDTAALDGARALAMTVVDLWTDPALLGAARAALAADRAADPLEFSSFVTEADLARI